GCCSLITVPMLKENTLIGAIAIYRQEVRPFTDKQIELVKNFAAQAVIAIENTRLLNELRQRTADLSEALDQQTATSHVLQIISRSPGDLEPVFQSMLENATRICEAKFGVLHLYENGLFEPAAVVGAPPALIDFQRRRGPFVPQAGGPLDRLLQAKKVVHSIDLAEAGQIHAAARLGGARSHVALPMVQEGELVGAITISPPEGPPFTDQPN